MVVLFICCNLSERNSNKSWILAADFTDRIQFFMLLSQANFISQRKTLYHNVHYNRETCTISWWHWKPGADNAVTVSKQTRKMSDFPNKCSIRYCSLSVLEGYYLRSMVPLNFQLHNLSKATLIFAKSVQYMAICLQKLPKSLLVVSFSYCIPVFIASFQCYHQAL